MERAPPEICWLLTSRQTPWCEHSHIDATQASHRCSLFVYVCYLDPQRPQLLDISDMPDNHWQAALSGLRLFPLPLFSRQAIHHAVAPPKWRRRPPTWHHHHRLAPPAWHTSYTMLTKIHVDTTTVGWGERMKESTSPCHVTTSNERKRPKTHQMMCLRPLVCSFSFSFDFFITIYLFRYYTTPGVDNDEVFQQSDPSQTHFQHYQPILDASNPFLMETTHSRCKRPIFNVYDSFSTQSTHFQFKLPIFNVHDPF